MDDLNESSANKAKRKTVKDFTVVEQIGPGGRGDLGRGAYG
jgi:hypothetical protein